MHRWFHIFIAALSLLVLLGGCDSENIENSAKKKERERLEQQQKQEEQRRQEEERRRREEEKRRKKEAEQARIARLESIVGFYKGKRNGEDWTFEVKWYGATHQRIAVSGQAFSSNSLSLTSENEEQLVYFQQDVSSVLCRFVFSSHSLHIEYKELSTGREWVFEGIKQ